MVSSQEYDSKSMPEGLLLPVVMEERLMEPTERKKSRAWLKPTISVITAIVMAVTGANYAFNPSFTFNIVNPFDSESSQPPLTVINEPRQAPQTGSSDTFAPITIGDVAESNVTNPVPVPSGTGGSTQSPGIVSIDSNPDDGVPDSPIAPQNVAQASTLSGEVDISLVTRDPDNSQLLTDVCYVLVDYSHQGCDANQDGQVTFADIPYGNYTVRQTVTPAGYPAINDYEITVKPTEFLDGTAADVPMAFVTKQATEQNAPSTRNVSIATVDMVTNEKIAIDGCVEIVGSGTDACDAVRVDGQFDFLDVPAGGPYELRFDLPDDYELELVGGPLAIQVNADEGNQSNEIVNVRIRLPDPAAQESEPIAEESVPDDAEVVSETTVEALEPATLDITLRACPDHLMPQNVNPATDCTIPIDGADPAGVYWEGDNPGQVLLSQSERMIDGTYRTTIPANVPVSLRHLEPNLRDDYLAVGADEVDHSGVPTITLGPWETANITLYYYYVVAEPAAVVEQTNQPESTESDEQTEPVESPQGDETTMRITFRACPEWVNIDTNDLEAHCIDSLDAPAPAEIAWGNEDWESRKITELEREWDGAYIFKPSTEMDEIEISGLEPSVRDGFRIVESGDVVEANDDEETDLEIDDGETFTFEFKDDDDTREVFIYYYFD